VTATPSGRASQSAQPTADPAAHAADLVKSLSDADLVGQVLMPSMNTHDPTAVSAGIVAKYRVGSVIIENPEPAVNASQVRELTDEVRAAAQDVGAAAGVKVDLLMGMDQEYGFVTRIQSGVVQLPSALALGAAARPDLTEAAWAGAGEELAAAGLNVDFAPVADVLTTSGNYTIGSRSYGSDPKAVSAQVAAAVRGLQSAGVAATLKHFPGHGSTPVDSHERLPIIGQTRAKLAASDLPPFQAGISAGTWLVMSGHLAIQAIDPGVPASFSRKVLVDLLRTQMGFQGVVVTDSLRMKPVTDRWAPGEAAVRALLAGNDLLLMPPDLDAAHKGLLAALASGQLPRQRLVEAVTRVLTLKLRLAAFPRPDLSTVDVAANREAALAAAAAAVTVLRGPCAGAVVQGAVRVTASEGRGQQTRWLSDALAAQGIRVVSSGGQVVHLVGYGDGSGDLASGAAVTVAMDTPYVLRSATSAVRISTYSSTQASMTALAAVIAGKAKAEGRSPVAVTGLPRSACAG